MTRRGVTGLRSPFVYVRLALLALVVFASGAAAQTASTIGLGYPVLPIDGRAAALGTAARWIGSPRLAVDPRWS